MRILFKIIAFIVGLLFLMLSGVAAYMMMSPPIDPQIDADISAHFETVSFQGEDEHLVNFSRNEGEKYKPGNDKKKKSGKAEKVATKNKSVAKSKSSVQRPAKGKTNIAGIDKIASGTYFIDTQLFEDAGGNFDKYIKGTNAFAYYEDSKIAGFRLSGVSPHLSAIGLRDGDILLRINGNSLTSVANVPKVIAQVIRATQFRLDIKRNEKRHSLYYRLK